MIKWVTILFIFCSCNAVKNISQRTQKIQLDGSKSHAAPGQQLTETRWSVVKGDAEITNPNSLTTTVIVKRNTTFELWGKQTDGQTGRDSMNVIIK